METLGKHIIFFDGDCLIRNRFVQMLLKIDGKISFILARFNLTSPWTA